MRILYGINSNGQGHINRARTIIGELKNRGHVVDCILGGPEPPSYAYDLTTRTYFAKSFKLIYNKHSLNVASTILKNVGTTLELPRRLWSLNKWVQRQDYDLVVTDFDTVTSLIGKFNEIPIVSIDHQHSILHPKAKMPDTFHFEKIAMIMSIFFATPFLDYYFAIDYVKKPLHSTKGTLYPLLWKTELGNYDIYRDDHICVYLSHMDKSVVLRKLKKFSGTTFYVYGFDIDETHNNVKFKKTSRDGFLQDFCSSKGIISNAGFSITWEATIVGKPIYIIPHKGQFEQIVNSIRLQEAEHVISSMFFEDEVLESFLELTEIYAKKKIKTHYTTVDKFYRYFERVVNGLV